MHNRPIVRSKTCPWTSVNLIATRWHIGRVESGINPLRTCLLLTLNLLCFTGHAAPIQIASGLALSHTGNLISNGSFEDRPAAPFALYWATGTTNTPFLVPSAWSSGGGVSNYATWSAQSFNGPSVPHGSYYLYFGNGTASSISETPAFSADGRVTFSATPTIVAANIFSPPVTLSQTITGLTTGVTYGLSFWVGGEWSAANSGPFGEDGIFALDVSGYDTQYLAAPGWASANGLGSRHQYEFTFVPNSSSVTVTFTNWGHFSTGTSGWNLGSSTELILDDVIVNQIPEPSSLGLVGIGSLAYLAWSALRGRGRRSSARHTSPTTR